MAKTIFKYQRTSTGSLPGKSFVEQTELAIEEIRGFAQSANDNAESTVAIAKRSLETSQTAVNTSNQALEVSNNTADRQTEVERQMESVKSEWTIVRGEWDNAKETVEGYVADAINDVQESITNAVTTKTALDSSIATAESLKGQLDEIDDVIIQRGSEIVDEINTTKAQIDATAERVVETEAKLSGSVVKVEPYLEEIKQTADNIDQVKIVADDLQSVLVQSIKLGRLVDPIATVNLATGGAIVTVAKNIEAIRKVAESLTSEG